VAVTQLQAARHGLIQTVDPALVRVPMEQAETIALELRPQGVRDFVAAAARAARPRRAPSVLARPAALLGSL
jgi:hypothetical protein